MNTNNSCCENKVVETNRGCRSNNGFLIVVVLYILLAIIIGSCLY